MGTAFRATHTITFIAGKPGLYTLDGPDHCGEVHLADLGLAAASLAPPEGQLITGAIVEAPLLARPRNFHKGLAGSLAIVGGAAGMVGAALLAGRAAIRLGAGKVFLGLLTDHPPYVDYAQPELMLRKPDQLLADVPLTAVAAGPGRGTDSAAQRVLAQALRLDVPLVLDADALNLIAAYGVLQSAVQSRKAPTLLTPHPAECARLLEATTADVQSDRIGAAKFPVEGLSLNEGAAVEYHDVPFEQLSSAEKLQISVAVGLELNPQLKVLLIREGSALDSNGLKLIAQLAAEAGAQVWLERVSETKEGVSVLIEDGAVAS